VSTNGKRSPFFYGEIRDRREIFAARLNRRSQDQSVRSGDRLDSAVLFPHPRNRAAVIEPDDQLHFHRDFAAHAFDEPNDVGVFAARWHKVD
jgi:hypothetical protein